MPSKSELIFFVYPYASSISKMLSVQYQTAALFSAVWYRDRQGQSRSPSLFQVRGLVTVNAEVLKVLNEMMIRVHTEVIK